MVSAWMLKTLTVQGVLYQHDVIAYLETSFGGDFTRVNSAGNFSITPNVLNAFRNLGGDDVVWMRSERCWRWRERGDEPGRMQP